MADINVRATPPCPEGGEATSGKTAGEPIWDILELLYFAYRDFVSEADGVLADFGFGRAHHRVLHFVNRNPGLKVAELLGILQITKQSLARVLKQLIEEGYVEQREGETDRRQRRLFVTPQGEALAVKLAMLQTRRIQRAFAATGPDAYSATRRFLVAMINAGERQHVLEYIDEPGAGTDRRG